MIGIILLNEWNVGDYEQDGAGAAAPRLFGL